MRKFYRDLKSGLEEALAHRRGEIKLESEAIQPTPTVSSEALCEGWIHAFIAWQDTADAVEIPEHSHVHRTKKLNRSKTKQPS